jgi:hypothetical protein
MISVFLAGLEQTQPFDMPEDGACGPLSPGERVGARANVKLNSFVSSLLGQHLRQMNRLDRLQLLVGQTLNLHQAA